LINMSVEPVSDRVAAHPFSDHGRRFGRLSLEEHIERINDKHVSRPHTVVDVDHLPARLRHGTHMADQAGGATKIIGIKITERVLLGVAVGPCPVGMMPQTCGLDVFE
jgi:hypothetical protein